MHQPPFEVADVIRTLAAADGRVPGLRVSQAGQRVLRDLAACRTAKLGGHVDACDGCGEVRVSYNSCRNRHCPKCQAQQRAKWLENRCQDLLPVPYFHVVFTLPAELAPLALHNQREIYGALFAAAAATLRTIAADPQHLGAQIGFIAVLHTWGQTLVHHPHLHCVIPGGGLAPDAATWISCRDDFFLPVRVLSGLFRGKMLAALQQRFAADRLHFHGALAELADPARFRALCDQLRAKQWVVYAKPPFGGPERVLKYLARYTHRVAIANSRITAANSDSVSFRYQDYAGGHRHRVMKLDSVEFLRRFLQHVLPNRFVRIRHYGLLANRARKQKLPLCRHLIAQVSGPHMITAPDLSAFLQPAGDDHLRCPVCHAGTMRRIEDFHRQPTSEYLPLRRGPPRHRMTLSPQHHPFDFITHSFEPPCRYCCAPVRVTCRDLPANCSTLLHRTLPAPGSPFSSVPSSLPGHAQHSADTPTPAFQSP